jgi:hypothetical protein
MGIINQLITGGAPPCNWGTPYGNLHFFASHEKILRPPSPRLYGHAIAGPATCVSPEIRNHVGKILIINHPFGNGLYHLFMGMVCTTYLWERFIPPIYGNGLYLSNVVKTMRIDPQVLHVYRWYKLTIPISGW